MHEVGVAKEVLSLCLEKAEGKKIRSIKVELGDDGHTTPESLTHAFEMVAKGTSARGARLEVIRGKDLESRVIELEVEQ
ncbi:MAG TPA: hydrogenase maturation nickel metallochaperone HypA [Candidatus Omnitrophota bacterium]|nr:hydrogenase maturation nickel metallochaperone HypA [Candidatus Omnitrophota bacterium]HQJ15387.1 hydrogenase maturation nickel metallochaperone HypA [Candidatus Omnitrophota bacterium]